MTRPVPLRPGPTSADVRKTAGRGAIDLDALAWLPQVELAVAFTAWAVTFVGLAWTLAGPLRVRTASN